MQKVSTHLWFDNQANQAADFFASIFPAQIINKTILHNTPSGTVDIINLQILDREFTFINAGPNFTFNPSISLMIASINKEEIQTIWNKLSLEGQVLMELDQYPFSPKYGWLKDRYGLTWQLLYTEQTDQTRIIPALMFVGSQCGRAEEAINFYTSTFIDGRIDQIIHYGDNEPPNKPDTVQHARFELEGKKFIAMDSAIDHKFNFSEAISFIINCYTQEEIDYYWGKLSAVPESEQCGWLKDKFGVSWQVHPVILDEMMRDPDQTKVDRVTKTFLAMKKFSIQELQHSFNGH